ncbi:MAG: hypothetical protein WBP26_04720 [Candidatus Saccharimonadales bacterium]
MIKANITWVTINVSKRKLPNPFQSKVVTADTLAAQTSPNASSHAKKPVKKLWVFVVIGVLIAAGLGVGGYIWWHKSEQKPQVSTPKMPQQKFSSNQLSDYEQYSKLIAEKKYDEARALVAKMQISELEKQAYYKDIDYLTSDKTEELNGYLAKEGTDAFIFQDAMNVGDIYAGRGDTTNAKKYYQMAIDMINKKPNPTKQDTLDRIEAKINAL